MKRSVKISALVSCTIALALLMASPVWATNQHLYDPVLSLTGGTAVSAADPVPDPGPNHPAKGFEAPCGAATDPHGYIYVSNPKQVSGSFIGGRIDVFNPQGEFVVEFEHSFGEDQCGLAIDSEGNVYSGGQASRVDLFEPSSYPPTPATTYSPVKAFEPKCGVFPAEVFGTSIDPSNNHFYIATGCGGVVHEYGSAAEGSPPIREIVGVERGASIDVYGASQDIYVLQPTSLDADQGLSTALFVLDGSDGHAKCEIKGDEVSEVPGGIDVGKMDASIAVDQSNGDVYLYDIEHGIVYQFAVSSGAECEFDFIGQLPKPPTLSGVNPLGEIAVDAPIEAGEPGYDSPNEGYVYVTSGKNAATSHLWAFRPKVSAPPEVEEQEAAEIGETEALLRAQLNPNGLETTYHFEYTTQASFDEEGYEGATSVPVPDESAGEGGANTLVFEQITDLNPDTAYRFRLVASNCEAEGATPGECETIGEGNPGGEGEDASFSTYPVTPEGLPDNRAYELVTPPDTNGRIPTMGILGPSFANISFGTMLASPDGESVVFGSNSGALPGLGGSGFQDTYRAERNPVEGWQSEFTGPSPPQADRPKPGGISSDHDYAFFVLEEASKGSLAYPEIFRDTYLRVPPGVEPSPNCAPAADPEDGFEWIGCGSLGFDPSAGGNWISEGGDHVILRSGGTGVKPSPPVQLEPCAPPSPVRTIYDRTPGGETRCVSEPPSGASAELEEEFETEDAAYKGVNLEGTAVAFTVADTLYVRLDNTETVTVAEDGPTFGGISKDGSRVFFLKDPSGVAIPRAEIYFCEVDLGPCAGPGASQEPVQIGSGEESALVHVSPDGTHLYFSSPVVLSGEEENGEGAKAQAGKDNFYAWDGEAVRFIAALDPDDLSGVGDPYGHGLGRWVSNSIEPEPDYGTGPANNPSRTTPDGEVLVFQARADLTGFESDGHSQVYRYDAEAEAGEQLSCLSCNPTGTSPEADSRLQTDEEAQIISVSPIDALALIPNVTADGEQVVFESGERLVPQDLDGKVDVYEWRVQGKSGCTREAGCLALISGGRSPEDDYLYAMTPDGSDVFFRSADTLVPQDPDGTPSIYDARVGGGFSPPEPPPGDCLGEACQPAVQAPNDATPATSSHIGPGNPKQATKSRCPKGKRKVRRAGRTRCVKRQSKKAKHHKRNDNGRAAR